eukprot:gene12421-biopygen8149
MLHGGWLTRRPLAQPRERRPPPCPPALRRWRRRWRRPPITLVGNNTPSPLKSVMGPGRLGLGQISSADLVNTPVDEREGGDAARSSQRRERDGGAGFGNAADLRQSTRDAIAGRGRRCGAAQGGAKHPRDKRDNWSRVLANGRLTGGLVDGDRREVPARPARRADAQNPRDLLQVAVGESAVDPRHEACSLT